MGFVRLFVRNPVVANLLMVAVFVLGGLSFIGLPRELMSEILDWQAFDYHNTAVIRTLLRGKYGGSRPALPSTASCGIPAAR